MTRSILRTAAPRCSGRVHGRVGLRPATWAALVAALLLGLAAKPGQAAWAQARHAPEGAGADEHATTDRLIVHYRADANQRRGFVPARAEAALAVAANRQGVRLQTLRHTALGAQVLTISRQLPYAQARVLAQHLAEADPGVDWAEPDRRLQAWATPNDPLLDQQWALNDSLAGIRVAGAWDRSVGKGVVVAVLDTGVRPHADLAANLLAGYDFVTSTRAAADGGGRDNSALDPGDQVPAGFCGPGSRAQTSSWHGTHVAGIVAANGGNGSGVAGVAWAARLLPVRVLGKCGGYTSDTADAIVWAAGGTVAGVPANAHPARVINLSLGGLGPCDRTTQAAVDAARARGAVVVAAAGNDATDVSAATPANCRGVVAVAATNKSGGRASYSNRGLGVALSAPGGDSSAGILSTLNSGSGAPLADSYARYSGTSMAAPVVSGVAALMLAANSGLNPDQVTSLLKSSARPMVQACSGCGAGIVDANAAVALALNTDAQPMPAPVAPDPTPSVLVVAEREPNNSLATSQLVASWPAQINGSLSTQTDTDYYKLTLAAGTAAKLRLSMGATSELAIQAYSTQGKLVASATGSAGLPRQLLVQNAGRAPLVLVLRVLRSSGAAGAYQITVSSP